MKVICTSFDIGAHNDPHILQSLPLLLFSAAIAALYLTMLICQAVSLYALSASNEFEMQHYAKLIPSLNSALFVLVFRTISFSELFRWVCLLKYHKHHTIGNSILKLGFRKNGDFFPWFFFLFQCTSKKAWLTVANWRYCTVLSLV